MPNFNETLAGILVILAILMTCGQADLVWKGIAYARYYAIREANQPWGNPSIFKRSRPAYSWEKYR